MENKNENKPTELNGHALGETSTSNKLKEKHISEKVVEAHEQADADMERDPDLGAKDPNADLDEGEMARLEGGETPVVE